MIIESGNLKALPFTLPALTDFGAMAKAEWKLQKVLRHCAAHEMFFSDFIRGCDGECDGFCRDLSPACAATKSIVMNELRAADALLWEVWQNDIDFVGIFRLSKVRLGEDALAHFFFFDGRLSKAREGLLNAWKRWGFTDHENWTALHRVTVEIPAYAFALARFAQRLGFGGQFSYDMKGKTCSVEGVKRSATRWRGSWHDMLIMGATAEE